MYLDPVQYLLDIHSSLPIINYSGKTAGTLHVRVRSWIDKMDTQPSYISIDREANISDFVNHMCLLRIHVDNMRHLPKSLCAATYVTFKFFFHSAVYKTPRHCGHAVNPAIDHTIAIDQKITRDFIDYIRAGCIEMEVSGCHFVCSSPAVDWFVFIQVFGKRHDPNKTTHKDPTAAVKQTHRVGELQPIQLAADDPLLSSSAGETAAFTDADAGSIASGSQANSLTGDGEGGLQGGGADAEKDRIIAHLQHQVEELTTEVGKRDKALAQSKRQLNAAMLDKANAEVHAGRMNDEKLAAESRVAELERALAEARRQVQDLLDKTKEPTPAPPVQTVAVKSSVCVIS